MTEPRFTLPAEPVDGFVLEAWQSDTSPYSDGGARCLRYVYRLKCTWKDLYPDFSPGADFENEWQLFDNERFSGRVDGWLSPLEWLNARAYLFATRSEALENTAKYLRDKIEEKQREIANSHELLLKIEDELGVSPPGTPAERLAKRLKKEGFHVMLRNPDGSVVELPEEG